MTKVIIDGCSWTLGESIGSGGFGRVYVATANGQEAVVKLVPKDPGAQRELLLVGDLSGVPNVVPVIGVGEIEDSLAIVMPRAEQSLRDFLDAIRRPLEQSGTSVVTSADWPEDDWRTRAVGHIWGTRQRAPTGTGRNSNGLALSSLSMVPARGFRR